MLVAFLVILGISIPTLHAQFIQQGLQLAGTGYTGTDIAQGYGITLSSDGNTLAWGGQGDNSGAGAAWVFTRSGSSWSQQGNKIVGTNIIGNANFGTSIALTADGNILAIGGMGDNTNIGATWIFTQSAGVWTQLGNKLIGTGGSGGTNGFLYQGSAVCVSANGSILAVGGNLDNNGIGATWLFFKNATGYFQYGSKLVPSDNTGNSGFGQSVACSSDGTTIAIGGQNDNNGIGATWVFVKNLTSGNYVQQGSKLVGSGAVSSTPQQGWSISISSNGNTLAIGSPYDGPTGSSGAVWVFKRSGTTWTQYRNKLVGNDIGSRTPNQAGIGYGVGISGDGLRLVAGGPFDSAVKGATWVFIQNSTGDYAQQGSKLVPTDYTGGGLEFGYAATISTDGFTMAAGGIDINGGVGAAWAFLYTPTSQPTVSPSNSPSKAPTISHPSATPTTSQPTRSPTTSTPTESPTKSPTVSPTSYPTWHMTSTPSSSASKLVLDIFVYSWILMLLTTFIL
jgi:hypothetical protein